MRLNGHAHSMRLTAASSVRASGGPVAYPQVQAGLDSGPGHGSGVRWDFGVMLVPGFPCIGSQD